MELPKLTIHSFFIIFLFLRLWFDFFEGAARGRLLDRDAVRDGGRATPGGPSPPTGTAGEATAEAELKLPRWNKNRTAEERGGAGAATGSRHRRRREGGAGVATGGGERGRSRSSHGRSGEGELGERRVHNSNTEGGGWFRYFC